ncbi:hypothetical protein CANINC_004790 [Pichia inconspicua]|uniref:Uncharacterized protein n=1 Tax=Pichia inconspicua TaxID=52247 RepID=A0A4T0WV49_9ASCO|nr:hypothetical protein CANINC_004790 [[Candida] inconspicua]
MNDFEFLINSLPGKLVDTIKSNVLNILFTKSELLVNLMEHEEDSKHYQIHDLLICTQEYQGFSLDDGMESSLSMINLYKSSREALLRLLKKGIVSIKMLTMTHILENLEFLVKYSEYVVFDDPYNSNFENMSNSIEYHKYIDEVKINSGMMYDIDFFETFPNHKKLISIEIGQLNLYESIIEMFERSKNEKNEFKFKIYSYLTILKGRLNETDAITFKRVKEYLKKNRGIDYVIKTKLTIYVGNEAINLNLLDKYIEPKEVERLEIKLSNGDIKMIPDIRKFINIQELNIPYLRKDLDLSKFKKLNILSIDEIKDFSRINNSMPKNLKNLTIRLHDEINKIPIIIPSSVETLTIESDKDLISLGCIDLTKSQVFNIMLFSNFELMFEHDDFEMMGQIYGLVKQPDRIKKFDYLPESVKYFTIDAGLADTSTYEIESSLFVSFYGKYTNFNIFSPLCSLKPQLYNGLLFTGRCEQD